VRAWDCRKLLKVQKRGESGGGDLRYSDRKQTSEKELRRNNARSAKKALSSAEKDTMQLGKKTAFRVRPERPTSSSTSNRTDRWIKGKRKPKARSGKRGTYKSFSDLPLNAGQEANPEPPVHIEAKRGEHLMS